MEKVPVNDGGQAFPGKPFEASYMGQDGKMHPLYAPGMSLRDWYAGMALNGLCASPDNRLLKGRDQFAAVAFVLADAMLEARK